MSKSNYLKSGAWYIFGNLLIKGITFFTLPIFTRILDTADFGRFNLFVSYENIINVVIGLGVVGTIKTAYFDFKDEFKQYFGSILSLVLIFANIIDLILNILLFFFKEYLNDFWGYQTVNMLIAYSLATALYNLISTKYVIEVSYKKNLLMSFGYTILSIVLSLVLCFTMFSSQKYMARIVGNVLPLVLITYPLAFYWIIKNKTIINKEYWAYALKLGIPLIFHSLSMVIMQQADKIMVNSFCGNEETGIYSLACSISLILTIIQSSIDNSWAPWFYTNLEKKNYHELCKKNTMIVYSFAYLTMGFILISPEIVYFASPEEYQSAIYALIPLNISVFASFMYMFAVNKEYFYKKTRIIASGTVITTILNIVLNALLIPRFGFICAAYTTLISKVVLFIIHWVASNKIDSNKVIEIPKLLYSFLFVVIISLLVLVCKEMIIIRYALIVVISLFAYHFIKKDINIFKSMKEKR